MSIFLSFGGRLSRQPFVILCLALLGMYTLFSVLFVGLLGGFTGYLASLGLLGDVHEFHSIDSGLQTAFILLSAIMVVLIFVSSLSICIRRLHDRDKSGWWLLTYYLVSIILTASGWYMTTIDFLTVFLVILAVQCLLSLWLLINLCFLRGTTGPNPYGSDPLTQPVADASIFG